MSPMERVYVQKPPSDRFFAGLDLGQAADYTALAILQRRPVKPGMPPWEWKPFYTLRYCQRMPLGTPYPNIVDDMAKMMRRPEIPGCVLAVDQTGVGRPVVDLFRKDGNPVAITITAGRDTTADEDGWKIPKKELVACLQLLFQEQRLKIPPLPERDILVKELRAFRVKVNLRTGNETFEAWRERDHDDLVLAVAMAAWVGEQALGDELEELSKGVAVKGHG